MHAAFPSRMRGWRPYEKGHIDMKKIAILTSGGDSPGMNCAVRSVVRYGIYKGLKVAGISYGYRGLIEGRFQTLHPRDVSNIIERGGTFLKSARSNRFLEKDGREVALANLLENDVEGMVVIGGNGSYNGALLFHREFGFPVIGIPGTIDNDINGSQKTLGFDTALNTAIDAVDKIKDTSASMDRIFLVEVMGRFSGSIAVSSALAGGAEDVLVPGEPWSIEEILKKIDKGRRRGKHSWIIIVAEGACQAQELATKIKAHNFDVRATVIGHIQRGGSPSAFDRILGALMGRAAVDGLLAGNNCHAVGWRNENAVIYPLEEAVRAKAENYKGQLNLVHILT